MRALPPLSRDEFARRGFVVLRAPIISRDYCDLLNARLEKLLRGEYDVPGGAPDACWCPRFERKARTKAARNDQLSAPGTGPSAGPSSRSSSSIAATRSTAGRRTPPPPRGASCGRPTLENTAWRAALAEVMRLNVARRRVRRVSNDQA